MKGLPKKYARMGFSKGWKAYKAKNKTRSSTPKVKKKTKVKTSMAKKKRASFRRKKSGSKDFLGSAMSRLSRPLIAGGYGFVREKISDAIANSKIGQQLPVTNYTDEVTMIAVAEIARMAGLGKNQIGKKAISMVKTIEWARIGENLADDLGGKKKSVSTVGTTPALQATVF